MSKTVFFDKELKHYYFNCPHCDLLVQVPSSEIRCSIFRHAVFKDGMKFVPPHASKEECKQWLENGLVYGCAKPFRFNGREVVECGYV